MSKYRLKDQAARDKIETCLDQTFLVEAGAGSGKTHSLVMRMVALLVAGACRPEGLAAVTFTHKAAGELKERFQVELEERFREEKDQVVKERLGEALQKIEQIFTGTIHSFCARLLRERPVEAGITPDFSEIEGLEEQLLEEEAWEQYLVEIGANIPAVLERLEQLDLSYNDLLGAFKCFNLYPDVQIIKEKTNYPDLKAVRNRLDQIMRSTLPLLPADEPDGGWDGLQRLIRTAKRWDDLYNLKDDRYFFRLLEQLNKSEKATYKKWQQDKDEIKLLEQSYSDFRDKHLIPTLEAWYAYRHFETVEFIEPAVNRYREMRRRENMLNFQDLLMLTADLLRQNGEVRGYFQESFSHLLIDEFQDTDPIQAEIVFYLAGSDNFEKGWTKLKPRPGSLFVVGDPKQSIYRFRRADIATYDLVKQLIRASGGEVLTLTTNFRSVPELISWSNATFRELFGPGSPPYQAGFTPMDDTRPGGESFSEGLFKFEVEPIARHKQEQIAQQDAQTVARWIVKAVSGGIRLRRSEAEKKIGLTEKAEPGDFLIIVSKKNNMSLYAKALEANNIAFTLTGGNSLKESTELKELLNLLQALADPNNPVALVATLRGLFYGISDDQLYRFKVAGGQFNIFKSEPEKAEPEIAALFNEAWSSLLCFHEYTKEMLPSSAIEKIAEKVGLIPSALVGEFSRGRSGSIMQAFELLRKREEGGFCSFGGAVDYLERLLAEGVDEDLAIDGGSSSAVQIINLHKAKGLEAPVVILANPGNHKVFDPNLHVARSPGGVEGYLLIDKVVNDYGKSKILAIPPQWDDKKKEEEQYRDAEFVRLLYVAATRAKNLLIISTYKGSPEKSPWQSLEKYLDHKKCRDAFSALEMQKEGAGSTDASFVRGARLGVAEAETEFAETELSVPKPITASMLKKAEEQIEAGLEKVRLSTYKHISGTALGEEAEAPQRKEKGRGPAWGTLVHAALEALVKALVKQRNSDKDADLTDLVGRVALGPLAETVIKAEGQSDALKGELVDLLGKVTASDLGQRILKADKVLTETPFGLWEESTYSTGIADLAILENGSWLIVDYKSDLIEDEKHLQALVKAYTPQAQLYKRCWEKITGEKVAECGLFFTDNLKYSII